MLLITLSISLIRFFDYMYILRRYLYLTKILRVFFNFKHKMENRNYLRCYSCNGRFRTRTMARIDRDENAGEMEIAINRRNNLNLPPLEADDQSRLCINCNRLILEEIRAIEEDPDSARFNVLRQTWNGSCLICNAVVHLQRLSTDCRASVFLTNNILSVLLDKCVHE